MLCHRLKQLHVKPLPRRPALGRPGAAHVSRTNTWFGAAAAAARQTQGVEEQSSYGNYEQHIESNNVTSTQHGQIQPWLERIPQLVPKAVAVAAAVALASLLVPHVAQAAAAAATAGQEDSMFKSKRGKHVSTLYACKLVYVWHTCPVELCMCSRSTP